MGRKEEPESTSSSRLDASVFVPPVDRERLASGKVPLTGPVRGAVPETVFGSDCSIVLPVKSDATIGGGASKASSPEFIFDHAILGEKTDGQVSYTGDGPTGLTPALKQILWDNKPPQSGIPALQSFVTRTQDMVGLVIKNTPGEGPKKCDGALTYLRGTDDLLASEINKIVAEKKTDDASAQQLHTLKEELAYVRSLKMSLGIPAKSQDVNVLPEANGTLSGLLSHSNPPNKKNDKEHPNDAIQSAKLNLTSDTLKELFVRDKKDAEKKQAEEKFAEKQQKIEEKFLENMFAGLSVRGFGIIFGQLASGRTGSAQGMNLIGHTFFRFFGEEGRCLRMEGQAYADQPGSMFGRCHLRIEHKEGGVLESHFSINKQDIEAGKPSAIYKLTRQLTKIYSYNLASGLGYSKEKPIKVGVIDPLAGQTAQFMALVALAHKEGIALFVQDDQGKVLEIPPDLVNKPNLDAYPDLKVWHDRCVAPKPCLDKNGQPLPRSNIDKFTTRVKIFEKDDKGKYHKRPLANDNSEPALLNGAKAFSGVGGLRFASGAMGVDLSNISALGPFLTPMKKANKSDAITQEKNIKHLMETGNVFVFEKMLKERYLEESKKNLAIAQEGLKKFTYKIEGLYDSEIKIGLEEIERLKLVAPSDEKAIKKLENKIKQFKDEEREVAGLKAEITLHKSEIATLETEIKSLQDNPNLRLNMVTDYTDSVLTGEIEALKEQIATGESQIKSKELISTNTKEWLQAEVKKTPITPDGTTYQALEKTWLREALEKKVEEKYAAWQKEQASKGDKAESLEDWEDKKEEIKLDLTETDSCIETNINTLKSPEGKAQLTKLKDTQQTLEAQLRSKEQALTAHQENIKTEQAKKVAKMKEKAEAEAKKEAEKEKKKGPRSP